MYAITYVNDIRTVYETPNGQFATYQEALMANTNPNTDWQTRADALVAQLNTMLTGATEINEFFAANGIQDAVVAALTVDPTGQGIVDGTTYTAERAVSLMALMSDIQTFIGGDLTPIDGLPVPAQSRRKTIRRVK